MNKDLTKIQREIKEYCAEYSISSPVEHRVLDLASEVGEVAKEVLKMSDYGNKPLEKNSEIESEIGDVFFTLLVLSNQLDIKLDNALEIVLNKYNKRLIKGGVGSENE